MSVHPSLSQTDKVAEGLVESRLSTPASPPSRRVVRPPVIDMRQPSSVLRPLLCASLMTTSSNSNLCPMICLVQHGLEKQCSSLASLALKSAQQKQQQHYVEHSGEQEEKTMIPSQIAHDLDDDNDGPVTEAASELRAKLTTLVYRILDILFDTNVEAMLTSNEERLNGRMCLREYSATTEVNNNTTSSSNNDSNDDHVIRLGAHIDHTLLTVLWSNSPGLEVFSPSIGSNNNTCWTVEHVLQLGMPTFSRPPSQTNSNNSNNGGDDNCPEPTKEDWAMVDIPWITGALLLTIGAEWLTHPLFAGSTTQCCSSRLVEDEEEEEGGSINCAVLHRVSMPINTDKTRYSLPFLVSIDKSPSTTTESIRPVAQVVTNQNLPISAPTEGKQDDFVSCFDFAQSTQVANTFLARKQKLTPVK